MCVDIVNKAKQKNTRNRPATQLETPSSEEEHDIRGEEMTTWSAYCDFMKNKGFCDEVMIISTADGTHWASSPDTFVLREYNAAIAQEDGSEQDQVVNEASNVVAFMQGKPPAQGLRLNGGKKQTVIRNFKDEKTGGSIIYGKIAGGGSCVADGGRCIVIGTFSEAKSQNSSDCNDLVTLMARYLKESTWPDGMAEGEVDNASGGRNTWQPFIDSMLVGKGNVAEALICSKSDGRLWASTKNFSLQKYEAMVMQDDGTEKNTLIDETKAMATLMTSSAGYRPPGGIRVSTCKYQFLKSSEEDKCLVVLGKKPRGGCCLMASNQVIVVATFDEGAGHTGAACNSAVDELCRYLLGKGY